MGLDESKIYNQLEISDKPGEDGSLNSGNQVTNDLKLLIKAGRLVGVHVSPTVLFNVSTNEAVPNGRTHTDFHCRVSMNQAFRAASQRRTGRSGCRRTLFDSATQNFDEMTQRWLRL